jgi:hypothetical protein
MLSHIATALAPHAHAMLATCTQKLSIGHNSGGTVLNIIHRYCGRSYRAIAQSATGLSKGIWRAASNTQSVALRSGTVHGGWQWEPTGGTQSQIRTIWTF